MYFNRDGSGLGDAVLGVGDGNGAGTFNDRCRYQAGGVYGGDSLVAALKSTLCGDIQTRVIGVPGHNAYLHRALNADIGARR